MRSSVAARRVPVLALILVLVAPMAAVSVTKSQVDAACADSEAAYADYQAAQEEFLEASLAFESAANDVAAVERKQANITGAIETRRADMEDVAASAEQLAVEMYMRGAGAAPGVLLSVTNVGEAMSTAEMLEAASADDQRSLANLVAMEADLTEFSAELVDVEAELRAVEAERLDAMNRQDQAQAAAGDAYAQMSDRCRELNATYKEEQAAAAARAAADAQGRGGGAAGASPQATSGFICPMAPGRTSFIDSWGYPRSGGRSHKGTDMMAAFGEPVYAVASGTTYIRTGGIGGRTVWLVASNGTAYYYAHLASQTVGNGSSVSKGQQVGTNGNTGNASGGAPHVHFEIHPGGRGSAAVNPYPTLAAACF